MRALRSQDLWAGLIFVAIGAFAVWASADYAIGRAAQMGPGFVPRMLGIGLVLFGLVIGARGLAGGGELVPRGYARPVLVLIGGILLFGLAIDRAGLVITCILVTIVTAFAARGRPNIVHVLALAVVLAAAAAALFVYGLKQAIPIWWEL